MEKTPITLCETAELLRNFQFSIREKTAEVELGKTKTDGIHTHSCYEIYFSIDSRVSFFVDNQIYPVTAGDVVFSRPCDTHYCIYHTSGAYRHICFWFRCGDASPLAAFVNGPEFRNLYSLDEQGRRELAETFSSLIRAVNTGDEIGKAYSVLKVFELLKTRGSAVPPAKDTLPELLRSILAYIEEHPDEELHIADIASKFFVSPATVNRLFVRYLCLSPKKYIEAKRLSLARKLLAGNASVTEVAMAVGFNDCAHFIAVFRKKFGETPKQYRQHLSTENG